MQFRPSWDLSSIPDDLLTKERNRRVSAQRTEPTREKVLRPCPKCGKPFGARELRIHKPRCTG
jgi:ssDNA-binding Zn-finger/Zn-ribbon topoisomerase 1